MTEILILLDVNGVFGSKLPSSLEAADVKLRSYDFNFYEGIHNFIDSLSERYSLGIFSSTGGGNVCAILRAFDNDFKKTLSVFMDRSMTSFDPDSSGHDTVKLLSQFWNNPIHNSERKWHSGNTLLVDDDPVKVRFNDERNVVIATSALGEALELIHEKANNLMNS